jgi:hypothetical protein
LSFLIRGNLFFFFESSIWRTIIFIQVLNNKLFFFYEIFLSYSNYWFFAWFIF